MSDLEFATGWERYRIPMLLAGGLALYGASRIDATRQPAGVLLTYGFPLIAVLMGVLPFRETRLFSAAAAVGAAAAGAAELAIGSALLPDVPIFSLLPDTVRSAVTLVALLLAAIVQALGSSRGVRNFFAAWIGMVSMCSVYLPGHAKVGHDSMDAFMAALLVSLFVGGGSGMLLGGIATRFIKREPEAPAGPKKRSAS
jgi:hypothetical protein